MIDLAIIIIATVAFALLTLGIAATIDYRDWGLVGLMVLCGGVAMLGVLSIAREEAIYRDWWDELHWTWLLLVCVGAALVLLGQVNRIKNHWAWPPKWRIAARIVAAAVVPFVIVFVVHLLGWWMGP